MIGSFFKASLMAAYQHRVFSFGAVEWLSSWLRQWNWFRDE